VKVADRGERRAAAGFHQLFNFDVSFETFHQGARLGAVAFEASIGEEPAGFVFNLKFHVGLLKKPRASRQDLTRGTTIEDLPGDVRPGRRNISSKLDNTQAEL